MYDWKSVRLEECKIERDWKNVRFEDCERDCVNVCLNGFHRIYNFWNFYNHTVNDTQF